MTVSVKKGWLRLKFWCPLSLAGFGIRQMARRDNEYFVTEITDKKQIKQIIRALKAAKKYHGRLALVSVKAADGTRVIIRL